MATAQWQRPCGVSGAAGPAPIHPSTLCSTFSLKSAPSGASWSTAQHDEGAPYALWQHDLSVSYAKPVGYSLERQDRCGDERVHSTTVERCAICVYEVGT